MCCFEYHRLLTCEQSCALVEKGSNQCRCQDKTLQGPIQHPPREPAWQVYTGARTRLSRAQSSIHHESLRGTSTQVPGQDSPGPNPASTTRACVASLHRCQDKTPGPKPASTTRACVASLHRCQDKTLQGPSQHPPRESAWQLYTGARTGLSRAQASIHHESLCGKSSKCRT